jgi:V/A-type H+-transporting ATPase subunit I
MAKVRILGPRTRLEETLEVLLDFGMVHLAPAAQESPALRAIEPGPRQSRQVRYLEATTEDIEAATEKLGMPPLGTLGRRRRPEADDWARWVRQARRTRVEADKLSERHQVLEEERARLARFARFSDTFEALVGPLDGSGLGASFPLIVRAAEAKTLEQHLEALIGKEFDLRSRRLDSGDLAVVLVVPPGAVSAVEQALSEAGIVELPMPKGYAGEALSRALPAMHERIKAIDAELSVIAQRQAQLAAQARPSLGPANANVRDRLRALEAIGNAAETERSFVLVGWLPERELARLQRSVETALGKEIVVERIGVEGWAGEDAPVVLYNPRIFRPFEAVTNLIPLPRYGTIDPTPFVAIFFPMFFGLILGDIGYGFVLLAIGLVVSRRARRGGTARSVGLIAVACSGFVILFGICFGEFFGDLGRHLFGLHPLVLDREESLMPFLALAVALGFVHILLGLVLGVASSFRNEPRKSLGRGISALMVVLISIALLAAVEILPAHILTPMMIAILVVFPILIVVEGLIAPIELLSTFSNILSYTRIMALGTASVMMAVVANRLAGAMGSVVIGTLFGLLFHLVNFALGVFAPTIHGLRLHYVEFFGKFVSPGGTRYEPLRHWHPHDQQTA